MNSKKPERVWPIAVAVLVVVALCCTSPLYLPFRSDDSDVVYEFTSGRDRYRIQAFDTGTQICAALQRYRSSTRSSTKWPRQEDDCAWPAVAGGDATLAGGKWYRLNGFDAAVTEVVFFGVVPGAAAEVRLTLATGATVRVPTRPAGIGDARVYGHQEKLPAPVPDILVTGVGLRDAQGGELRVL